MANYNVIDIDPGMDYAPGEEVIGTVEAATPDDAIAKVMWDVAGINIRTMPQEDYALYLKPILKAVEVAS
jgi:hypothetical protein